MNNSSQSAKQRKRSIVFWLFFICSIPLIIGVIGYASGYRFNSQSKTLTATSLISVSTIPKGATVTLNDEPQEITTPFMQNVEPGEYTILVTLDGYQRWEKHVTIAEGKSAVFINSLLFQKTPTIQEAESIVTPVSRFRPVSPDEAAALGARGFANTTTLRIMDNGQKAVLSDALHDATWLVGPNTLFDNAIRLGKASIDAQWSEDGSTLAFMNAVELWTYTPETQERTLMRRQSTAFHDLTWSTDSRILFVSDAESIAGIEVDPVGGRQRWSIVNVSSAQDLVAQKTHLQFTVNGKTFNTVLEN